MTSTQTQVAGLFKKNFVDKIGEIKPTGHKLIEMIGPIDGEHKQGESIDQAITLSYENGYSLLGSAGDSATLNGAKSSVVKQASIKASEIIMQSEIPFGVISRSATNDQAFAKANKQLVKNNLASHMRLREHLAHYGQSGNGLGNVGKPADGAGYKFRGQTVTVASGAFTVTSEVFGSVTLTNGVDTTNKLILIRKGDFAPGIFTYSEGLPVEQVVTAGNAVAGSGAATGLIGAADLDLGIIQVDFTPVAATTETSHYLALLGQRSSLDMVGAHKILTNTTSLFNINAALYSRWRGTQYAAVGTKPTFGRYMKSVSRGVNKGLEEDVTLLLPISSWDLVLTEQAALRQYAEKNQQEFVQGAEQITFYGMNGKISLEPDRFMRESHHGVFVKDHWHNVGSSDVSLRIPGFGEGDLVVQSETKNTFIFRSYSDSQIYCEAPALNIWGTGWDVDAA